MYDLRRGPGKFVGGAAYVVGQQIAFDGLAPDTYYVSVRWYSPQLSDYYTQNSRRVTVVPAGTVNVRVTLRRFPTRRGTNTNLGPSNSNAHN